MDLRAGCDDRRVAALAQPDCPPEGEVLRYGGIDLRVPAPAEAEIDRPLDLERGPEHRPELVAVSGAGDDKIGDGTHGGQVFERVVAGAVEAERDAGVVSEYADGHPGIRAVGADLLHPEQRGE